MSYSHIRTAHSVGDTVYFYDEEEDCVYRVVVVSIEAHCAAGGYSPKWDVFYRVEHKFAREPARKFSTIDESSLKDSMRDAFPPEPPQCLSAPELAEAAEDAQP